MTAGVPDEALASVPFEERVTEHRANSDETTTSVLPADQRPGTLWSMDVDQIWSAAELEALTPDERSATIRAGS